MDARERIDSLHQVLLATMDTLKTEMWSSMPGIVQSFDAANQTVQVQVATAIPIYNASNQVTYVQIPLLRDVPVIFEGGGDYVMTFPVSAGDECLVVFSSRCIDAWWQNGGVQNQADIRYHDLSDGFAIVGPRSLPRKLSGVSTNTSQWRNLAQTCYVELTETQVNIVAALGLFVDTINASVLNVTTINNVTSVNSTGNITTSGGSFVSNNHGTAPALVTTGTLAAPFSIASTVQVPNLNVEYAGAIDGGTAGDVLYQIGTSSTGFIDPGTATYVLTSNGPGTAPSFQPATGGGGGGGTATYAENLTLGVAGDIPYQTGSGATSFVPAGTAGYLLESQGSGQPVWVNPSTLTVGTAAEAAVAALAAVATLAIFATNAGSSTSASAATSLSGGVLGDIPYQTGPGATTFVAPTTIGSVLELGAGTIPAWVTQASLSVGTANEATNIAGGVLGDIPYQTAAGTTTFVAPTTIGSVLELGAGTVPAWVTQSSLSVGTANEATNIAGGVLGDIPYQTGPGATSFVAPTTIGSILELGASTIPAWVTQASLSVGTAALATLAIEAENMTGGVLGDIPYQTASGASAFVAPTTIGSILELGAGTIPAWVTQASLSVGTAATATNISGGTVGDLVYQTGTGATGFIAPGTSGYVLSSNGPGNAPSYVAASALPSGTAAEAIALAGGIAYEVPYQTGVGATTFAAAIAGFAVLAQTQTSAAPAWQNLGVQFTASSAAPVSPAPNAGDRWINTSTGFGYVYFNDGSGAQWIQLIGM